MALFAALVHLVNLPILFTSTAQVPARQMPDWLAAAARFNPLTLAVDAWRGALLSGEAPTLSQALALYALAAREMRGGGRLVLRGARR